MLNFVCQSEAVKRLNLYAKQNKHSIVIEGVSGSGKTYIAKQYANMLNVQDVVNVPAKVSDIKQTFIDFSRVDNSVLIVIENLDQGVPACSYALLKFMEEPTENMYIIVTCTSKKNIPETILSRSMTVTLLPPTKQDIVEYCRNKHADSYFLIKRSNIWDCVYSFSDADEVCSMTKDQRDYIAKFSNIKMFSGPVSDICWKLGHYSDGSEITSNIIVKYVMSQNKDNDHVVASCKQCLDQLDAKRIARYLTLTKLAFDLKYCE